MTSTRAALAVILNEAGQVLMHLRDDIPQIAWPGYWSLPGGSCNPGETPAQAIVRELREEAGLEVGELTECFSILDTEGSGQWDSFFLGCWDGDEGTLDLTEGVELRFFAPEEVSVLMIPPYIRDGIRRIIEFSRCPSHRPT